MRALLKLSCLVRTLIIDSIRLFLRNLVNHLMIALLGFVAVLVTWMSFASVVRELRRGILSMLETLIVMSSLIFHLISTLVLGLALLLLLCLTSLMDLTIAHMVLVHERTTLCLDVWLRSTSSSW
jgi:hypothetical protein